MFPQAYANLVQHLALEDVERAYTVENFHLSNVLHAKYRIVRVCVGLFVIGIVLAFISVVLT